MSEAQAPAVNSRWRHTNGAVYQVAVITNVGSVRPDYPPTVVYFNLETDTWWSRPVSSWSRSMTPADN
jgi:hypothetical protein